MSISFPIDTGSGNANYRSYSLNQAQSWATQLTTPTCPPANRGSRNRNLIVIDGIGMDIGGYGQDSSFRFRIWDSAGNHIYNTSSTSIAKQSTSTIDLPRTTLYGFGVALSGETNYLFGVYSPGYLGVQRRSESGKTAWVDTAGVWNGFFDKNTTYSNFAWIGDVYYYYLPIAPGITGVSAGRNSVSVSWNHRTAAPEVGFSDITGYNIHLYCNGNFYTSVGVGVSSSYTFTNVPSDSSYVVFVSSNNGASSVLGDSSDWSRTGTVYTPSDYPTWTDTSIASTARVASYYSDGVSATGAAHGYQLVDGSLPPGISLNTSNGSLTGTPTTAGEYRFTIRAVPSDNTSVVDVGLSITVYPQYPVYTDSTLSSTLRVGTVYSDGVSASYASGYSLAYGSLPAGLSLNTTTGAITGTPTTNATYSFTIRALTSDVNTYTDAAFNNYYVNARVPIWTDNTLGSTLIVGAAYSDGVTANYASSYSVSSGTLPTGLSLNASTGALTGTPSAEGTFTFTLRANTTDSSTFITQSFSLTVQAPYPYVYTDNIGTKVRSRVNVRTDTSTWNNATVVKIWNGTTWSSAK